MGARSLPKDANLTLGQFCGGRPERESRRLRQFVNAEITNQQLLDHNVVLLVNGVRIALNLRLVEIVREEGGSEISHLIREFLSNYLPGLRIQLLRLGGAGLV